MLFKLLLLLFLVYEIQKIFQFNYFFRLVCISTDYRERLLTKTASVAYQELMKIILVDLAYVITLVIGLFTINKYFMFGIIFLSIFQTFLYRITKNKIVRKIEYILNITLSIILLLLSLINIYFYHLDSITLINTIF
jgi:hypothetical protein